jgi:hypothetical protein
MALERATLIPSQNDISAEFSSKNIQQTLKAYKALKHASGDYTFGEITAKHFNLTGNELKAWQAECALYPSDAQDEIKRTVIYALSTTDDNGNDAPIPIVFQWQGGSVGISTSYIPYGQPNGPSFTITISGYPEPGKSSLTERRAKKNDK